MREVIFRPCPGPRLSGGLNRKGLPFPRKKPQGTVCPKTAVVLSLLNSPCQQACPPQANDRSGRGGGGVGGWGWGLALTGTPPASVSLSSLLKKGGLMDVVAGGEGALPGENPTFSVTCSPHHPQGAEPLTQVSLARAGAVQCLWEENPRGLRLSVLMPSEVPLASWLVSQPPSRDARSDLVPTVSQPC